MFVVFWKLKKEANIYVKLKSLTNFLCLVVIYITAYIFKIYLVSLKLQMCVICFTCLHSFITKHLIGLAIDKKQEIEEMGILEE